MSQLLQSEFKISLTLACNVSHCLRDAMLLLLLAVAVADHWIKNSSDVYACTAGATARRC
jgi:hypothetical protein